MRNDPVAVRPRALAILLASALVAGCGGDATEPEILSTPVLTRGASVLTEAQADQLERDLRGDVINVEVACCGSQEVDSAVLIAYALQAAMHLPDSAPFLVRGSDHRLAAKAADRLGEAGMPNVWLVTR